MVTERHYHVGEWQTTLGGGTAISGGGTPSRPVPAEFNHSTNMSE